MSDHEESTPLKRPTTYKEQVELLVSRGMIIENEEKAISILRKINYYRLSAYMLPFKNESDSFDEGTNFNTVFKIYEFDMKLRTLFMSLIELVEIAFRAHIANVLSHDKQDPLAYLDPSNFIDV